MSADAGDVTRYPVDQARKKGGVTTAPRQNKILE
jgi:hypothetical protein